ncbi:DUF2158 domain-containing protein [Reichenbachiella sp. MALMAid0571]|uniref:YodC family protein n=1 Tax=Reichenbachiella sp. MALMAid0571 TaxID=3143939 RepID=UPI0032DF8711
MGQKFKSGDVVYLKSGGPKMTVKNYEPEGGNEVICTWFVDKKPEERAFPEDLLELYKPFSISTSTSRRSCDKYY